MSKEIMWFKKSPMKSLTCDKNIMHDNVIDSECQTEEGPSCAQSDLSILAKCLELMQDIGTDDGFELQGFPNVLSVQKLLLQQAHHSLIQYTPSEAKESCSQTQNLEKPIMFKNHHLINLKSLKRPYTAEECDFVIKYWHSHFPASKLKQFYFNKNPNISKNVLLEATLGLMADSEFLSCDRVDMKWTCFLEGALAQATSEYHNEPIKSIKNLLHDFNYTRVNAIEQNKTIIATTESHQVLLENSICRMRRLARRVALILKIPQRQCLSALKKNTSIVQLPKLPKTILQKSYLIYFKGMRICISPIPGNPNLIQVVESNSKKINNKSAVVLAMELLLHAGPEELQILHMRDLDSFFEFTRPNSSAYIAM